MVDFLKMIESIEKKAEESALTADLATDPEARTYNTSLARKLRDAAQQMREQLRTSALN